MGLEASSADLWKRTAVMLQSEWPGIVAMARLLRERRHIKGDEFENEWRRRRPREAIRAKRIEGWE